MFCSFGDVGPKYQGPRFVCSVLASIELLKKKTGYNQLNFWVLNNIKQLGAQKAPQKLRLWVVSFAVWSCPGRPAYGSTAGSAGSDQHLCLQRPLQLPMPEPRLGALPLWTAAGNPVPCTGAVPLSNALHGGGRGHLGMSSRSTDGLWLARTTYRLAFIPVFFAYQTLAHRVWNASGSPALGLYCLRALGCKLGA